MEPHGAVVVPHALPGSDDIRPSCSRQGADRGKGVEERWIFFQDAAHLRLLEHNF
jgi:hypothetical protein